MIYSTCLAQIEAKTIDLSLKALLIILKPNFLSNSRLILNFNVSSTPLRQAEQQQKLKPARKKREINIFQLQAPSTDNMLIYFYFYVISRFISERKLTVQVTGLISKAVGRVHDDIRRALGSHHQALVLGEKFSHPDRKHCNQLNRIHHIFQSKIGLEAAKKPRKNIAEQCNVRF
jgi:hypothetical protein